MYIIAGLGNPESKYENTRHNAGFMALDVLADRLGVDVNRQKFRSLTGTATVNGEKVLLMKPLTYMNNSGEAIAEAASYFKIPPENIVVICDDINMDPGMLRIRRNGSAGGHNGLKSIIQCVGSDQFPRIKVGVGNFSKVRNGMTLVDFVMGKFSAEDKKKLESPLEDAGLAAELIIEGDTDEAMNRYNRTK